MKKNITSLSLRDILELLFKYKIILILCFLSVSIPVSIYSFYRYIHYPLYETHSKIMIERKNPDKLLSSAMKPWEDLLNTEIEILLSRPVIEKAIYKYKSKNFTSNEINNIINNISVLPSLKTNILTITFRHTDVEFLAPFVNNLTDEYIRKRYMINKDIASVATNFLEQEKEIISKELSEARDKLKNFKSDANLFSIEEQKKIYLQKLEDLNLRLKEVSTSINSLEEKKKDISNELKKDTIEILPYLKIIPETISKLETLLLELELKKDEIIKKFNEKDKEVRFLSNQIELVKKKLKRQKIQNLLAELKKIDFDIKTYLFKKDSLTEQIEGYTNKIAIIEDKKIIIDEYIQTINYLEERNKGLFRSIYKVKEIGDIEQHGSISIYKIEDAVTPEKPVEPRPILYSIVGGIIGLFFGFIVIILCKYFDHSFQNFSDISNFLELPLLTTFPYLRQINRHPIPYIWKQSPDFLKSCKQIQNIIQNHNNNPIKTILFTGSILGEGTTTVVSNIATFLSATSNLSILLIDGNLEDPGLHNLFRLSNDKGLAEILNGEGNIKDVIKSTEIKKLCIIPIKKGNDQIEIGKIGAMIKEVKNNFDLIIIDGPPTLQSPDILYFSREADAVFYIIEAEKTQAEKVQYAQTSLIKEGINPAGIILNNKKRHIPDFIYKML